MQACHLDSPHQDFNHNGTFGVPPEGGTHFEAPPVAMHWHFDLIA
jgi:hypothetical protein